MSGVEAAAAVGVNLLTKVKPHEVRTTPTRLDKTWAHIKTSIQNDGVVHSSLILALANTGLAAPVRLLLSRGTNVDTASLYYKKTPVIQAARNGHENVVQLLLNNGAKINAQDRYGFTALIWASINNHEPVVRMLVERGADLNLRSAGIAGRTALQYAVDSRSHGVIRALQVQKNGYS